MGFAYLTGLPHPRLPSGQRSTEIGLLDLQGVIVAANQAWLASSAALAMGGAGVGASYFGMLHKLVPGLTEQRVRRDLATLQKGQRQAVLYPYAIRTSRGPRWRQIEITLVQLGEVMRFVVVHRDLTALVRAEEALRSASEQLLVAQEEERQRIAIELHDSTGQHLAALSLGLARLRRRARDEDTLLVLDDMSATLKEAVQETRVISYLMTPSKLLREGLLNAASRFTEGLGRRAGLSVEFTADGPVDEASPLVQHAAFRIVQEALSNVYRHASAHRVQVSIRSAGGMLTLCVSDDGDGFQGPTGGEPVLGVGIPGMRARVEQLNGSLEVTSAETGTCVVAIIPITV